MTYRAFGATATGCPAGQMGVPPFCVPAPAPIENKKCPACTYGIPPYCCPYGTVNVGGQCFPDSTGSHGPPPEFAYCTKGGTTPPPPTQPQGCPEGQWGTPPLCLPGWGQPPSQPSRPPQPSQPQGCPQGTFGTPPICFPALPLPGPAPGPAPGPTPPGPLETGLCPAGYTGRPGACKKIEPVNRGLIAVLGIGAIAAFGAAAYFATKKPKTARAA